MDGTSGRPPAAKKDQLNTELSEILSERDEGAREKRKKKIDRVTVRFLKKKKK